MTAEERALQMEYMIETGQVDPEGTAVEQGLRL